MKDYQYSYWLAVQHADDKPFAPDDIKAIADDLSKLFDGDLVASFPEPGDDLLVIHMEVPQNVGTVCQISNAFDIAKKWAAAHPDYTVSLKELNEEDHIEQRYAVFLGDETLRDTRARLVDADADVDWPTVDSVAEFVALMIPGDKGAVLAQRIRDYYRPHCSNS